MRGRCNLVRVAKPRLVRANGGRTTGFKTRVTRKAISGVRGTRKDFAVATKRGSCSTGRIVLTTNMSASLTRGTNLGAGTNARPHVGAILSMSTSNGAGISNV